MIQTLKTTFKLETSMSVNAFLFYFKRIPLLGGLFSDKIYGQVSLKTAISVLVFLLQIIKELVIKSLMVGLSLYLPVTLIYSHEPASMQLSAFTHLLFVIYCVILPFLFSDAFEPSRPKIIAIKILHIPAKRYYLFDIFYKTIRDTILLCPSICVFTILAKGTFLQGLYYTLACSLINLIGEAFHLLLYKKTKYVLRTHMVFLSILILLFIVIAYLPVLIQLNVPTETIFYSFPFALIMFVVSLCSILYIIRYQDYGKVFLVSSIVADSKLDKKKAVREATFREVTLKDADLASSLLHQETYKNKHGYAYLNALFFERHRRMLLKPMFITLACIGVCFLAGVVAILLIPEFSSLYMIGLSKGFPSLVFIMYILSTFLCQRATKAMFYNCDISLLRYAYYRKKNVILLNFRIRLKKVLIMNGLPALAIAGTLLTLGLLANQKHVLSIVPIIILVIILSIFFSVHHLFMYYVFQPFTTDLDVKNPVYKIVNGIIYMASYMCLQIRQAPSAFVIIILVATIVYTIIALILILRMAPKTFRVK